MDEQYYYVGIGEKSYFYTLNFSFLDYFYPSSCDGSGLASVPVRKHVFIRNLSHDFNDAMAKAVAWHHTRNLNSPLNLLDRPFTVSERKQSELNARLETIKSGLLPFGKFRGQHVSTVDKSYIHWVVLNIYNHEIDDDAQNVLGAICFNYADEQGWIDSWENQGLTMHDAMVSTDRFNSVINGDMLLVGKFRNQCLKEFAYTRKSTLKAGVKDYLIWLKNEKTSVDQLISDNRIPLVLSEDGCSYFVLRSEHFIDCIGNKPSDSDLTILMIRQMFNKASNLQRGEAHYPLYRFDWGNYVLSLKSALSLSTCD